MYVLTEIGSENSKQCGFEKDLKIIIVSVYKVFYLLGFEHQEVPSNSIFEKQNEFDTFKTQPVDCCFKPTGTYKLWICFFPALPLRYTNIFLFHLYSGVTWWIKFWANKIVFTPLEFLYNFLLLVGSLKQGVNGGIDCNRQQTDQENTQTFLSIIYFGDFSFFVVNTFLGFKWRRKIQYNFSILSHKYRITYCNWH